MVFYPEKICDALHGFIRFDTLEKEFIDSPPFQRLRHIRQMGMAYLVYPGCLHSRFEHSLGVMEIASRIYDSLMGAQDHRPLSLSLPKSAEERAYWRRILRLAALCHDLGHLPFSHTAEELLLPGGGHELMTEKIILSASLRPLWQQIGSHAAEDILALSVGGAKVQESPWKKMLSQIIVEDNFGADRIDYLIRDSFYSGAGYGHFDSHQLIDSLRILPVKGALALGVTQSGLQAVESLWIARYFMYARVYHHLKCRVYTHHMCRLMTKYYAKHGFPSNPEEFLKETDYRILLFVAEEAGRGDEDAAVLQKQKESYRPVTLKPKEETLHRELLRAFGDRLFFDSHEERGVDRDFPILTDEGVVSSLALSSFLRDIPEGRQRPSLFGAPHSVDEIRRWLKENGSAL